jgi:uncharacterized cupredoxin-like copper-binding protein
MKSQACKDRTQNRTPAWVLPVCKAKPIVWLSWMVVVALLSALPLATVTAAPLRQTDGSPVSVSLVDFEIRMPNQLPAGPTTFTVTNEGTHPHNFEIEGQGIEQVFEANLQPGESNTMTIDLPPGDYVVYCPVDDHRGLGMELTLTVTEAAAEQAAPPAEPTAAATPAVLPVTGGDHQVGAAYTWPVVALLLVVLVASTWVVQRRQA